MKILVYGWYHQGNIGDDLFMEAYHHLFPDYEFVFTETIDVEKLNGVDAVFFGGGSFLLGAPSISMGALEKLKSKKILYLGVGVEDEIHPVHVDLMKRALMIATRSHNKVDDLKVINKNTIYVPDLVYSLQSKVKEPHRKGHSVLIIPNTNLVPQSHEPYWKHTAWNHFKSEFSQFMDWLVDCGYHPTIFSMCEANKIDDNWAACELVSSMINRSNTFLPAHHIYSFEAIAALFSQFSVVVTQRYHGIVLSEMTRTPYVAIHHHDKLKFSDPAAGVFVSYYDSSKNSFIKAFGKSLDIKFINDLPIEPTIFETFSREVTKILK